MQRISEYLSQAITRPASAPPSYDDAMKIVNEAFEISDEEEEEDRDVEPVREDHLPPEYTEIPRPDEEVRIFDHLPPDYTEIPRPDEEVRI